MSVLIIDADGELWYKRQQELNVDYIKMPFSYGGEEYYYDLGLNTDFRKFYDAVRGGEIPKGRGRTLRQFFSRHERNFRSS